MSPIVVDLIKCAVSGMVGAGCYYMSTQKQNEAINIALNNPNIKSFDWNCTKSSSKVHAEFYRNKDAQMVQAQQMMYTTPVYQQPMVVNPVSPVPLIQNNAQPQYYGCTYDPNSGTVRRVEYY